jgi:hypothetical protein
MTATSAGDGEATEGEASEGEITEEQPPSLDNSTIQLGVVVTPALDEPAVEKLSEDLADELAERYPGVNWRITMVRELLLTPPATLPDIVDAARSRLMAEDWDLVVYVTELPLRISRRPLLTHSSPTHSAALVSLPALGPMPGRRLARSVADAVGVIAGDTGQPRHTPANHRRRVHRRLVDLANEIEGADTLEGVALLHRVLTGNLRLLAGMVRANHPWRLATHLSHALIGALGAAAFAVVTSDVWRIAASLAPARLAAVCVATIALAVAALIGAHRLWERAPDRRVREQAILFNLVTLITVGFGIVVLYGAVCAASLAAAGLMIRPSVISGQIGHHAGFGDYLRLALLASALGTAGGALGGALESDAAVREATYAYRRHGSSSATDASSEVPGVSR